MNERPAILVIEDDRAVAGFLATSLSAAGYSPWSAATLSAARARLGEQRPALIILDLGLPDGEGREFIGWLRTHSDLPLLVLSARQEQAEKVACLDLGADDYLAKPFGVDELLARVRTALRHARAMRRRDDLYRVGGLEIDLSRAQVRRDGLEVHLTATEFRLLGALVSRAGKVCLHRQLLAEVWGPAHVDDVHYLRIHMGRLRAKLEAQAAEPRYLLTEPGIGYRLADG